MTPECLYLYVVTRSECLVGLSMVRMSRWTELRSIQLTCSQASGTRHSWSEAIPDTCEVSRAGSARPGTRVAKVLSQSSTWLSRWMMHCVWCLHFAKICLMSFTATSVPSVKQHTSPQHCGSWPHVGIGHILHTAAQKQSTWKQYSSCSSSSSPPWRRPYGQIRVCRGLSVELMSSCCDGALLFKLVCVVFQMLVWLLFMCVDPETLAIATKSIPCRWQQLGVRAFCAP
jgi:hypothetical protein